jgi:hypothetical protein
MGNCVNAFVSLPAKVAINARTTQYLKLKTKGGPNSLICKRSIGMFFFFFFEYFVANFRMGGAKA